MPCKYSVSVASSGRPTASRTRARSQPPAAPVSDRPAARARPHHVPSGKTSSRSRATCRARRVFPVPPGPVKVSRLTAPAGCRPGENSRLISAISFSRPTKLVSWVGRLCGVSNRSFNRFRCPRLGGGGYVPASAAHVRLELTKVKRGDSSARRTAAFVRRALICSDMANLGPCQPTAMDSSSWVRPAHKGWRRNLSSSP